MLVREWVENDAGQGWKYLHESCKGCHFFWHYHPEFELTFTRGGRGMRYIGSDAGEFGVWDLALVAPNQPHTWHSPVAEQGKETQVIFFTLDWLKSLGQHAPELGKLTQWLEQIRTGVVFSEEMAKRLAPQFERLHGLRGLERLACLFGILGQLQADGGMRMLQGYSADIGDRRLTAALTYLQDHYTEALSLEQLAAASNSSPATVKRLFAQQMRTTYSELLAELRIGHATGLLLGSEQSIPALAQASGFPTLSQFYRKFAELKGCAPAAYRRRYRLPA